MSAVTVLHWEAAHTEPPVTFMPAIVRFLGYEPWRQPETFGERMLAYRRLNGLPIKTAAERAGIDENTWSRYERVGVAHDERCRLLIEAFVAGKPSPD